LAIVCAPSVEVCIIRPLQPYVKSLFGLFSRLLPGFLLGNLATVGSASLVDQASCSVSDSAASA
jgi:hypothetical protein